MKKIHENCSKVYAFVYETYCRIKIKVVITILPRYEKNRQVSQTNILEIVSAKQGKSAILKIQANLTSKVLGPRSQAQGQI